LQAVSDPSARALQQQVDRMIQQAREDLRAEGIRSSEMRFLSYLDMRYSGQSFELTVPFGADILTAFHQIHEHTYGHAMYERQVEVVTIRLQAIGTVEKPVLKAEPLGDAVEAPLLKRKKGMSYYDRDTLLPGMVFAGPALVFQLDSTTYVAPGWTARVDAYRNLVLERQKGK
jgi:N-methylhydantoinase A